jgi:thiosulfate/3-mercaptopyruvate sulfurtransferase
MTFNSLIEATALRDLVGQAGIAVLDCRFDLGNPDAGRCAFLEGHIPGARHADLNRDLSAPVTATSGRHPLPSPQELAATLQRLGIRPGTQVIAYDDSGGAYAARAWWLLRWAGHNAVAVLNGGLKAWLAAGGALEQGSGAAAPAANSSEPRFRSRIDADAVMDAAQVLARLEDPGFLLIDARAADRFAGIVEPIDSVAGHVAGAVNHPFSANLAADGRFLPADELRLLWEKRLGGRSAKRVAAMCGSGITACHNLLALEVAGMSGAKLYPGSWSEWIRDPQRPIAQGA